MISDNKTIATPWRLNVRRVRYQLLPLLTVIACASLAGWIWARQNRGAHGTGEVSAVRVALQSKFQGVLTDLPRPVELFDTVRAGQLVARIDTSVAEAELRRLQLELEKLSPQSDASQRDFYRTRIDELKAQVDASEVKSPIDGTVVLIGRRPGEATIVDKPIMTIASDKADFIIGYIRPDQAVRPANGAAVELRGRTRSEPAIFSYVQRVGAQVEALPYRHWTNPDVVEWGLPVQIALPPEAKLKPGEVIDFVLRPAR